MLQETSTQKTCPQCGQNFDKSRLLCSSDGSFLIAPYDPSAAHFLSSSLVGSKIGPYEVLAIRNKGDKSYILDVKDESGERKVMKLLCPELLNNRSSFERFQQEARLALAMDHANSVKVHDSGIAPSGQPYLVMELLDGITLDKIVCEKGPLDLNSFRIIFEQVCDVLSQAHKKGIVHRDLKPEHVMVSQQEGAGIIAKLLDFGCSKDLERSQRLTVAGMVIGNPDYMSPEQCAAGTIDARTDIYSLGCIMYYALTGKKPFEGSIMGVMQKHISEAPQPIKQARLEQPLPEGLEKAIEKALNKDPNRRRKSVDEFWSEAVGALGVSAGDSPNGAQDKPTQESFLDGLVKHFKMNS